jgi:CMP-2-keto-3-deoxyoctulosonic acid synthetase
VVAILYYFASQFYRCSNLELQRLESISRTPIFTQFAETLSGTASIRALQVQDMYMNENLRRVDVNTRALYFSRSIIAWLQLRLSVIGCQ